MNQLHASILTEVLVNQIDSNLIARNTIVIFNPYNDGIIARLVVLII